MPKIDMTPTWEWAVKVHLMALENPNADESVKQGARDEIIRLARAFDQVQADRVQMNDIALEGG
jgi:hypothetical protein